MNTPDNIPNSAPEKVRLSISRFSLYLPNDLRFLLTTRPVPPILGSFPDVDVWDLVEDAADDRQDIRSYALGRIQPIDNQHAPQLAAKIETASAGNFLYAKFARYSAALPIISLSNQKQA